MAERPDSTPGRPQARPAHRPSRRDEIIRAAIRVFSTTAYNQTTVEVLAAECGVAPTAVYYHFGGKEELFDEAYVDCLRRFSQAVDVAREQVDELDADGLRAVIRAGWSWWRTHPVEGRMMMTHAGGATPASRRAHREWLEHHAARAMDYLPEGWDAGISSRKVKERRAEAQLTADFMNRMLNVSQIAWLDGPMSKQPMTRTQEAIADVLVRVMLGD